MSLPKHLKPQTYWEQRCALLESSFVRMVRILETYTLPPAGNEAVNDHFREWNRLLSELEAEFPAAPIEPEVKP